MFEPSISAFNVLNMANFSMVSVATLVAPGARQDPRHGKRGPSPMEAKRDRAANRVGLGSGIFSLAAPRQVQFGVESYFLAETNLPSILKTPRRCAPCKIRLCLFKDKEQTDRPRKRTARAPGADLGGSGIPEVVWEKNKSP